MDFERLIYLTPTNSDKLAVNGIAEAIPGL